jgi:NADH-quinone oxidoreductase subunit J
MVAILLVLLLAAAAAVSLRNLIHCALSLALSFVALGILFIAQGAEFAGFVQILVYVGAVSVLIVFGILLTRPDQAVALPNPLRGRSGIAGAIVAAAVLVGLLGVIVISPKARQKAPVAPRAEIAAIGNKMLGDSFVPMQATGVLLTAALIGAAILAKEEKQ